MKQYGSAMKIALGKPIGFIPQNLKYKLVCWTSDCKGIGYSKYAKHL